VSDEQTWVEQAVEGDRAAFGRLVEAYQKPVYNLAYRMLGNPLEAEDAAQEAFVRAYSKLHTYRPERKFSTWLLSITSHHCIDRLRRRRFVWLSLDEPLPPASLASEHGLPEEAALRGETRDEVRVLLSGLEPTYRAPIVLRYWHELSYSEIADTLGITVAAVKSRLHRARLKMARQAAERQKASPVLCGSAKAPGDSKAPSSDLWFQKSGRGVGRSGLNVELGVS
jgi:RNA polymerase sigma-70 factor (ECF subfamily)